MYRLSQKPVLPALLLLLFLMGCMPGRKLKQLPDGKAELADYTHDWLRYKIYLLPEDEAVGRKQKVRAGVKLSIRVINMHDNSSPLRRLCGDLQDYNTYYEYLLNGAKEEIYLQGKQGLKYPVYYAFENNYNAFPFETINLGYAFSGREQLKDYQLVFIDRVFSKDTIVFQLNSPKK